MECHHPSSSRGCHKRRLRKQAQNNIGAKAGGAKQTNYTNPDEQHFIIGHNLRSADRYINNLGKNSVFFTKT